MNVPVDATALIPGYHLREQLYAGSRTLVYRGIREADRQAVVIKLLNREYPTFSELLQFHNQYTITKNLDFYGIVSPLCLEAYRNGYALVMADFGGISLREYLKNQHLAVEEFLTIAIQMCDILHHLYQNRIIHKDIKPANILISPKTQEIKLIDFSIASLLPRETQTLISPNVLEGTLAYLSPEQTGRMNRGIDYRSDFYSLGVTFYELLTGELPFQAEDAMELVHCHLAKLPNEIKSAEIPSVISDIVMKLMAKNAEKRYQSALGLKFDLENCLEQLKATGEIQSFEIARRDVCDRFIIPDKLYGRETEVQTLLDAFERVSNGASELMLVAGFSGIGKTAVVNEVHKPIVRQRGYFIKGKFDQFNRNIPLSAFVQALRDLMAQLLSESDAELAQWQAKILAAVGENGQVLIDVIPELEQIIGKQPIAPQLSGSAAQNRFNLLFQKFIEVFTTAEHPLVLFLDDLQWADSASLQLLTLLMNDNGYLLILGAYRDNEVSLVHPFILTIEELKKAQANVHTITLAPLAFDDTNHLIADTLNCSTKLAQPLTELIDRKTQGNPFFTTQFLKALHEENHIIFNRDRYYWECDIAQINALALTDDVVEFMALQLQKLPSETQQVLKLAACVGNQFDLTTLAIVSERSSTDTATALWKALQEGLILPTSQVYKFFQDAEQTDTQNDVNPAYRFLHDRVQQAAYSLIPEDNKQITHFQIGQLLLNNMSAVQREERILEIVNHLNYGIQLMTSLEQQIELAQLNLIAGQKAKKATAHTAAAKYLDTGLQLLSSESWSEAYELTLALFLEAMDAEWLNTNPDRSEALAEIILKQATSPLDIVKVYETKIQIYVNSLQPANAIKVGFQALEQMGLPLSAILELTHNLPALPSLEQIDTLPKMTDPYYLAQLRLLIVITGPILSSQPKLIFPIVSAQVHLCLQHGHSGLAAFSYSWYGTLMCVNPQTIEAGYLAGQIAKKLLETFNETTLKCPVYNMLYLFINPWKTLVRDGLSPVLEGMQAGLEVGDLVYASYCGSNYCVYQFFVGERLEEVERELTRMIKFMQKLKNEFTASCLSIWKQLDLNLQGMAINCDQLSGDSFDEKTALPQLQSANVGWTLFNVYLAKGILLYTFNDHEGAITNTALASEYASAVGAWIPIANNNLYHSLALLAHYSQVDSSQQLQYLAQVEANQVQLHQWAFHAPMNFQHKYELVEAEKCRVLGQQYDAIALYDQAIAEAKANGYIQEEALANELAAKFYLDWGKEKVAAGYIQEAYYGYAHWGAKAKVQNLERRYPNLLKPILQQHTSLSATETVFATASLTTVQAIATQSSTSDSTSISATLDLTTVLKASQTLSGEIQLDNLLATLLHTVLENAGADKGVLLMPHQNQWFVEAVATIDQPARVQSIPLSNSQEIPHTLINSVKRSLQPVVIVDAAAHLTLATDTYVVEQQPKSLLCTPILQQGKIVAMLYLENHVTIGAFTSDRVQLLNFLCSQAAISLENARLYSQAKEKSEALQTSEKRYRYLATATSQIIWLANLAGENTDTVHWREYTGQTEAEAKGTGWLNAIHPDDIPHTTQDWTHAVQTKSSYTTEYRIRGADGNYRHFAVRGVPMLAEDGSIYEWIGTCTDIDDRKKAELALEQKSLQLEQALHNLQNAQLQIVQSEKMSALGNLVAGIAHEMNNPLGFISASLQQAKPTVSDITEHLKLYQETLPNKSDEILDHAEEIDLDYSLEDLPKMIDAMVIACNRLKNISTSLRTFSRADKDYKIPFNIHEGIDSTILILKHRLKANEQHPCIEVITEYGILPQIDCFPGQLNQVFMNILANAIDALEEANIGRDFTEIQANSNRITVKTFVENNQVKISIADNGKGMNEEVKQKIFEHLFTTKAVGKGTGLGLAIARQIIVEKHSGSIQCNSSPGEGTEFIIFIPI